MAGETVKSEAICLSIWPWSRTSHVTTWLTPSGPVTTVVKGAVRPKSAFLGQYDLNYTCDIVYYARAKGEAHALRECSATRRRDELREDYRALALADWFRRLAGDLAPNGSEAAEWFGLLGRSLDGLASEGVPRPTTALLRRLLVYELEVLKLAGLEPEFVRQDGEYRMRGERQIPLSEEVMRCIREPGDEKNPKILVDAARAISVFYTFHLDCAPDVRRTVLRMILESKEGK